MSTLTLWRFVVHNAKFDLEDNARKVKRSIKFGSIFRFGCHFRDIKD